MKILRVPTYWTAEQTDTIHAFLGGPQAAVWQAYHKNIQQMYEDVKAQNQTDNLRQFDDDIEF